MRYAFRELSRPAGCVPGGPLHPTSFTSTNSGQSLPANAPETESATSLEMLRLAARITLACVCNPFLPPWLCFYFPPGAAESSEYLTAVGILYDFGPVQTKLAKLHVPDNLLVDRCL